MPTCKQTTTLWSLLRKRDMRVLYVSILALLICFSVFSSGDSSHWAVRAQSDDYTSSVLDTVQVGDSSDENSEDNNDDNMLAILDTPDNNQSEEENSDDNNNAADDNHNAQEGPQTATPDDNKNQKTNESTSKNVSDKPKRIKKRSALDSKPMFLNSDELYVPQVYRVNGLAKKKQSAEQLKEINRKNDDISSIFKSVEDAPLVPASHPISDVEKDIRAIITTDGQLIRELGENKLELDTLLKCPQKLNDVQHALADKIINLIEELTKVNEELAEERVKAQQALLISHGSLRVSSEYARCKKEKDELEVTKDYLDMEATQYTIELPICQENMDKLKQQTNGVDGQGLETCQSSVKSQIKEKEQFETELVVLKPQEQQLRFEVDSLTSKARQCHIELNEMKKQQSQITDCTTDKGSLEASITKLTTDIKAIDEQALPTCKTQLAEESAKASLTSVSFGDKPFDWWSRTKNEWAAVASRTINLDGPATIVVMASFHTFHTEMNGGDPVAFFVNDKMIPDETRGTISYQAIDWQPGFHIGYFEAKYKGIYVISLKHKGAPNYESILNGAYMVTRVIGPPCSLKGLLPEGVVNKMQILRVNTDSWAYFNSKVELSKDLTKSITLSKPASITVLLHGHFNVVPQPGVKPVLDVVISLDGKRMGGSAAVMHDGMGISQTPHWTTGSALAFFPNVPAGTHTITVEHRSRDNLGVAILSGSSIVIILEGPDLPGEVGPVVYKYGSNPVVSKDHNYLPVEIMEINAQKDMYGLFIATGEGSVIRNDKPEAVMDTTILINNQIYASSIVNKPIPDPTGISYGTSVTHIPDFDAQSKFLQFAVSATPLARGKYEIKLAQHARLQSGTTTLNNGQMLAILSYMPDRETICRMASDKNIESSFTIHQSVGSAWRYSLLATDGWKVLLSKTFKSNGPLRAVVMGQAQAKGGSPTDEFEIGVFLDGKLLITEGYQTSIVSGEWVPAYSLGFIENLNPGNHELTIQVKYSGSKEIKLAGLELIARLMGPKCSLSDIDPNSDEDGTQNSIIQFVDIPVQLDPQSRYQYVLKQQSQPSQYNSLIKRTITTKGNTVVSLYGSATVQTPGAGGQTEIILLVDGKVVGASSPDNSGQHSGMGLSNSPLDSIPISVIGAINLNPGSHIVELAARRTTDGTSTLINPILSTQIEGPSEGPAGTAGPLIFAKGREKVTARSAENKVIISHEINLAKNAMVTVYGQAQCTTGVSSTMDVILTVDKTIFPHDDSINPDASMLKKSHTDFQGYTFGSSSVGPVILSNSDNSEMNSNSKANSITRDTPQRVSCPTFTMAKLKAGKHTITMETHVRGDVNEVQVFNPYMVIQVVHI